MLPYGCNILPNNSPSPKLVIYFRPLFHYLESERLYCKRIEFVSFRYFVWFESWKGHQRIEGLGLFIFLFVRFSWQGKHDWKCSLRSGQFSTFPLLGSQLAVGRGFFPCFQINCTRGLAKLQAGFRFGSSLRSRSQLLNPLQTTGQKWLRLGTLNHLFLPYFLPTLYPEITEENLFLVNGFSGFSELRELKEKVGGGRGGNHSWSWN